LSKIVLISCAFDWAVTKTINRINIFFNRTVLAFKTKD
jgi:hypothetical protein